MSHCFYHRWLYLFRAVPLRKREVIWCYNKLLLGTLLGVNNIAAYAYLSVSDLVQSTSPRLYDLERELCRVLIRQHANNPNGCCTYLIAFITSDCTFFRAVPLKKHEGKWCYNKVLLGALLGVNNVAAYLTVSDLIISIYAVFRQFFWLNVG